MATVSTIYQAAGLIKASFHTSIKDEYEAYLEACVMLWGELGDDELIQAVRNTLMDWPDNFPPSPTVIVQEAKRVKVSNADTRAPKRLVSVSQRQEARNIMREYLTTVDNPPPALRKYLARVEQSIKKEGVGDGVDPKAPEVSGGGQ